MKNPHLADGSPTKRPARSKPHNRRETAENDILPLESPRIPLSGWGAGVRAAVAVVFTLISAFLPMGLVTLMGISEDPVISLFQWLAMCAMTCGLAFLCIWAWTRYVERQPFAATGFRRRHAVTGLIAGTVAAAALTLLTHLIAVAFGMTTGEMPEEFPREPLQVVRAVVEILFLAFVLQGIPEELIYRGWLLRFTRPRPWFAFWWSTVVFTVLHLASQGGQESIADHFLYLVGPFGMAVLAAACIIRWGNGWIAAGIHGGFHVGTFLAVFTLPAIGTRASWIMGGVLYCVAAAIILRDAQRVGALEQFRESADHL